MPKPQRRARKAEWFSSRTRCLAAALACCGAWAPGVLLAQGVPDAGSLLQQNERRPQPAPGRDASSVNAPPSGAPPSAAQAAGAGASVAIRRIEVQGATLLSAEQLREVVRPFEGRSLTLAQIQQAAAAVAEAYAREGRLARSFAPPQDLGPGVLTLQVVEARFGGARVDERSARYEDALVLDRIGAAQTRGEFLDLRKVDRALTLANDLPGVNAKASLVAGEREGETVVALSLGDGPPWRGEVSLDNAGSRSTGTQRLSASVNLLGPLRQGDNWGLVVSHTEGSDYLRLAGSMPVGLRGWRAGVNAGVLRYRLVAPEFASLRSEGGSDTVGAELTYPLRRGREVNLQLLLGVERKQFDNRASGSLTSRYRSTVGQVGLSGSVLDGWGGSGSSAGALILSQGRLDLSGSPNQAADSAGARAAGGFTKLRYTLTRQQALGGDWLASLNVAGQWAGRNLDSSEKMYLGGAQGVRAYPSSEAGGSQAQIVNVELRKRWPGQVVTTAFYDWGQVRANVDAGFAGATRPNTYALQGAGLSVGWTGPRGLDLRATWARRIGQNPGATPTGMDQDGTLRRDRLWLQAALPF